MNVLEGSLEREGEALVARVGTATLVLPAEVQQRGLSWRAM